MSIQVTVFRDRIASTKDEFPVSLASLASWVDGLPPAPSKAHCVLISLTRFGDKRSEAGSLRSAENAIECFGAELDYDGEVITPKHIHETLKAAGIRHFVYTSASHRPEAPRCRVIVPFDRGEPVDARREATEKCNGLLGGKLSSETFTLSQPFFAGRVEGVPYESYLWDTGVSPLALDLPRVPWKGARDASGQYRVTAEMLLDDLRAGVEVHPAIVALAARGFSEEDLVEIVSSSCQHWERPERGRVAIESDIPRAVSSWQRKKTREVADMLAAMPVPPKPTVVQGGGVFKHLSHFVATPARLEWLIRDIIEHPAHVDLFGESGAGKSFVSIDWCLSVATGRPWQGHKVSQGSVAYLNGEGYPGWRRRVKGWMQESGITDEASVPFFATDKCWPLTDVNNMGEIWKALDALPAPVKLVCIDTLNRHVLGLDINSSLEMGRFVAVCDEIRARYNCTVLIVHHSGTKDTHRAMGSVALKGALDVEVNVSKKGNNLIVSSTKMKDGEKFEPMNFRLRDISLPWVENDDADISKGEVPRNQKTAVLEFVPADVAADDPNVPGQGGRPDKKCDILREVLREGEMSTDAARDKFCELHGGVRKQAAKAFNRAVKSMTDAGALIAIEDTDMIKLPLT